MARPKKPAKTAVTPVRFAVVGLGYIAQSAALPAFAHADGCELAALVSDDAVKRTRLARTYHVPDTWSYAEFDECLQSGIDAVYIALPNTQHAEFAIRAAKAGVHVLTEKPMATSVRDATRMIAAARAGGVRLMVAYRLHYQPANLAALAIARSGKLGDLRFFSSTFSMQVAPGNSRLRADLGGGSLGGLGIYCINAARTLFSAEPEEVYAISTHRGARFREVDEMTSAVLRFPGERSAVFTCSFGAGATSAYRLVGSAGRLDLDPAYEETGEFTLRLTVGEKTSTKVFPAGDQFAPEFIRFAESVRSGRDPEPSGEEGLADLRVIEALHRSARTGRAVRLGRAPVKARRVTPAQKLRRPPIEEPALVRAGSPMQDG